MSISFVQSKNFGDFGTLEFDSAPTEGNLLILSFWGDQEPTEITGDTGWVRLGAIEFPNWIALFGKIATAGQTAGPFGVTTGGGSENLMGAEFASTTGWAATVDQVETTGEVRGEMDPVVISASITPTPAAAALAIGMFRDGNTLLLEADSPTITIFSEIEGISTRCDIFLYRILSPAGGLITLSATWDGLAFGANQATVLATWRANAAAVPPIQVDVYTPDNVHLVTFDNLKEKRVRVELNGAGSGYFVIDKNDPQATEANLARGNIVKVTFGQIDPDPIFAFILEEGDWDLLSSDEEGGEEMRFGGPGLLAYLRRAVIDAVEYESGTGIVKPRKGMWVFADGVTEGHILNKMLNEARSASRPSDPIGGCTDTFNATTDSAGVAWGSEVLDGKWRIPIGSNLYDEALRLVRAGLLQIEMTPDLVVNAYRTIGTDRTSATFATGKVRFVKGVNIVDELGHGMAGAMFATDAIIRYGDGSYARAHKETGLEPYVQETYIEASTDSVTTARRIARGQMKYREDAQDARIFAHTIPLPHETPDDSTGLYLPGPVGSANGKYWVGDTVTLHTGTGEHEFDSLTQRVYAITLYEDEVGDLAPPIVELNAPYLASGAVGISPSPISNPTQVTYINGSGGTVSLSGYQSVAEKGEADGYASLDANGFVPLSELSIALDDLSNVIAPTPADGDVVVWSDYLQAWVNEPQSGGGASTLDGLDDVTVPTPGDGDFLSYDAGTGDWVNVGAPSGTVPDGTSYGDILVWNDYLQSWEVLPVGADDEVLTADSADPAGVKWAAPAGGGGGGGPFIDVTDYGATGDGTTDDTAAINSAIAAADATTGATIWFPPGTYKITTTITLTGQNYHLLGAGSRYGPSRIHMATANTTALSFAPSGSVALRTKTSKVENLVISGPGGASSGRGLDATNDLHVESCFIYGFYDGMYLRSASYYSYVARTTFTDCDRAGLVLDSTNNTTVDTCRFTGAFSGTAPIGVLQYGIYIGCSFPTGLNNKIVNSSIEYFTGDGIYGSGMFGCEISGNYFESQQSSSGHAHINLGPSNAARAVYIHGNYFQGDGTSGFNAIKGGTTDRITVTGNYFGVNAAIGIDASGGSNSNWLLVNNYNNPVGTFSLPSSSVTIDPSTPPIITGDTAGGDLSGTYPNPSVDDDSHNHTAATVSGVGSTILISDTPSTPLVFADLIQNEAQDDLVYSD